MRLKYLVVTILMIFGIVLLFSSVYPPSLWTLGLIIFLVIGEIVPWAWLAALLNKRVAATWWWTTHIVGSLLGLLGIMSTEMTPLKHMVLLILVLLAVAVNIDTKIKFFGISSNSGDGNE